jgi:hypothetical protein
MVRLEALIQFLALLLGRIFRHQMKIILKQINIDLDSREQKFDNIC